MFTTKAIRHKWNERGRWRAGMSPDRDWSNRLGGGMLSRMATLPETIQKHVNAGRRHRYVGEVVYMFAFDVATR